MPRPQTDPQEPAQETAQVPPESDPTPETEDQAEGIDPDKFIDPTDSEYVAAYIDQHGLAAFQAKRLRQSGTIYGPGAE